VFNDKAQVILYRIEVGTQVFQTRFRNEEFFVIAPFGEDEQIVVIPKPVATPAKRLPVINLRVAWSLSPAAFWIPSLMVRIPYRNSPRLPMTSNMCSIIFAHRKITKLMEK